MIRQCRPDLLHDFLQGAAQLAGAILCLSTIGFIFWLSISVYRLAARGFYEHQSSHHRVTPDTITGTIHFNHK
jgi:hypothetical protein